jgi:hypothetical protein
MMEKGVHSTPLTLHSQREGVGKVDFSKFEKRVLKTIKHIESTVNNI